MQRGIQGGELEGGQREFGASSLSHEWMVEFTANRKNLVGGSREFGLGRAASYSAYVFYP